MDSLKKQEFITSDTLYRQLVGGDALSVENQWKRPKRQQLLRVIEDLAHRSGRLIALLNIERLLNSKGVLIDALGIAETVQTVLTEQGTPLCQHCHNFAEKKNLEALRFILEKQAGGIVLLTVSVPKELEDSAKSLIELAHYWQAERVTNGKEIYQIDQLTEEAVKGNSTAGTSWFVVLDSAAVPLSATFERSLAALLEKVEVAGSQLPTLFYRDSKNGDLERLGSISRGWHCTTCNILIHHSETLIYSINGLRSDQLLDYQLNQVLEILSLDDELRELVQEVEISSYRCGESLRAIPLKILAFIYLVRVPITGLQEMLIIFDDIKDFFDEKLSKHFLKLQSLIEKQQNSLLNLSAGTRADLSSSVTLEQFINQKTNEKVQQLLLDRASSIDSFIELSAKLKNSASHNWKQMNAYSVADLRKSRDTSLGEVLGFDQLLQTLLLNIPALAVSSDKNSEKRFLCPKCFSVQQRINANGESESCECVLEPDRYLLLSEVLVKNKTVREWVTAPIVEIRPLIAGFAQSSLLLEAIIECDLGSYTLATDYRSLTELEQQVVQLLFLAAGNRSDFYQKVKSRRSGTQELLLLQFPFWGLNQKIATQVIGQWKKISQQGSSIVFLD